MRSCGRWTCWFPTQSILLTTAAQRADGNLLPMPGALRGGAATKAVAALLVRGLAEERIVESVASADPALNRLWRNADDGRGVLLRITAAGLDVLGIKAGSAAVAAVDAGVAPPAAKGRGRHPSGPVGATSARSGKTREGTKQALLVGMLGRAEGTTVAEIVAVTGWQPNGARRARRRAEEAARPHHRVREGRGSRPGLRHRRLSRPTPLCRRALRFRRGPNIVTAPSPRAAVRPEAPGRSLMIGRLPRPAGTTLGLAVAALLTLAGLAGGAAAQPRDVEVGGFVSSLSDINPSGGSFRVVLYVWFNDPAGRFNVERDLHLIARTASIDEIDTEPAPGGGSYTYARIEAEVPQEFDFRHFPFDRQRLTVRMEASETVEDLRFVPDHEDTDASDYLPLLGWTLDGVSIDVEEHAYDSDFGYWTGRGAGYSQIQLSLDISRDRSPVLIDDFLGFVFAFMITSLTFLVSATELGLRIGMNTGALFAAVVNLGRLHESAGFRPDFGLVDRLAFLVFGAILCSLIIAITTHRFAKRGDADRVNRIDSAVGAAMVLSFGVLIALTLRGSLNLAA